MYSNNDWRNYQELYHHGILGMKWGVQNGPPYPLSAEDHNASEKKAGWKDSLSGAANKIKDAAVDAVDERIKRKQNLKAVRSVEVKPGYPAKDVNGTKTAAAKVIKANMSKDQLKRLYKAGKRLDDAYDREYTSEDPKMEQKRSDWAEKEARKAADADAKKYGIDLGSRWHEKIVESYKTDVFEPMWDDRHPEYSQRNAGKESPDEAFANYKSTISDLTDELVGKNISRADHEQMYWILDRIETQHRK